MVRTVQLPYSTGPEAAALIQQWRQAQSVVIRFAYNRVQDGLPDREILEQLRQMPQGRLDSWLTLSALKKARAIDRAHSQSKVIFGGKHNFKLRSEGKITSEEWKAKRLLPLYFEGHAKSYGEQGGNHRFVLDLDQDRVLFYPRAKTEFELKLKLGKSSNYRQLLQALQLRCTWHRDVPFTVSLTATHISISWDEKVETVSRPDLRSDRALALDLNPNRIGVAVLEKHGAECKVLHWAVYDYPELNRKLHLASDHPETVHQNNKRLYELSQIAKEIPHLAEHYQCAAVVSEHLNIATKDHDKGKSFNRAVNNQWCRKGFILPLIRRLETAEIKHVEVNPAYSSKLGNLLWGWPLHIPDPACAAAEIGRRFLQEDPKRWARQNGGNRRKEERQVRVSREQSPDAQARAHWKQVWNQFNPKSGDTPRFTVPVLRTKFPGLCPRPGPFKTPSSKVVRLASARICHHSCGPIIRKEL